RRRPARGHVRRPGRRRGRGLRQAFAFEREAGVAMHDMTGVKRSWRGRGIAGALKRAEIAWAKRNGFTRLETANEERNEPIRRLNQRHGYVPVPGHVVVRGPVSR